MPAECPTRAGAKEHCVGLRKEKTDEGPEEGQGERASARETVPADLLPNYGTVALQALLVPLA